MATIHKFMFDLDFDDPEALSGASKPKEPVVEEEEIEPEIVVPTFSEEELSLAREEAYAEGFEAGRREAAEATEEKLLASVEAATAELANIYRAQNDANQEIAKEMILVAAAIAKKMFPDLNARNALGEVEHVVQETLSAITEEPRVQISVPPDLREPFMERLSAMTNKAGFDGKVFVNPDAGLKPGDCRIEWSNGTAVRDSDALWEMVDKIVERNIYGDDAETDTDEASKSVAESSGLNVRPLEPADDTAPAAEAGTELPGGEETAAAAPEPASQPAPLEAEEVTPLQEVSDDTPEAAPIAEDTDTPTQARTDDAPVEATSVDPLSPEMQAAILQAEENDATLGENPEADDDELTPEQET